MTALSALRREDFRSPIHHALGQALAACNGPRHLMPHGDQLAAELAHEAGTPTRESSPVRGRVPARATVVRRAGPPHGPALRVGAQPATRRLGAPGPTPDPAWPMGGRFIHRSSGGSLFRFTRPRHEFSPKPTIIRGRCGDATADLPASGTHTRRAGPPPRPRGSRMHPLSTPARAKPPAPDARSAAVRLVGSSNGTQGPYRPDRPRPC